jgi:hypothetical protein
MNDTTMIPEGDREKMPRETYECCQQVLAKDGAYKRW